MERESTNVNDWPPILHDVLTVFLGLVLALVIREWTRQAHASSVYCDITEVQHELISFEKVSGPGDPAAESRWWLKYMLIHPDDLELILSDDPDGDSEENEGFDIAEVN